MRDAANTLAQRNGLLSQTSRLYNTFTNASNYQRSLFSFTSAASAFVIGTETSTTAGVSALSALVCPIIIAPGYNQSLSATAPVILQQTWNNASNAFTLLSANVTDTASSASSLLMDLQIGGVSKLSVQKNSQLRIYNGYEANYPGITNSVLRWNGRYGPANTQYGASLTVYGSAWSIGVVNEFNFGNGGGAWSFYGVDYNCPVILVPGFNSGFGATIMLGQDARLTSDAANTLAQRNGINPQAFRLYNTFTDTVSTFERLNIKWDTGVLKLGTEKGSNVGLARPMEFQTNGTTRMTIASGGNVGIGTTNPAAALDVYYNHTNNGGFHYGFQSIINGGSNNTNVAGYFSATNGSGQVALKTGTGGIDFNGNLATTGNIFLGAIPSVTKGNVQIGDATSGSFAAGLGGLLTFSGDSQAQGDPARAIFAFVRGIKENSTYQSSLGALIFGTQSTAAANGLLSTVTEKMRISSNGNVGIGTTTPNERLTVVGNISAAGDIAVATSLQGVILVAPNSTRWKITVNNDGTLSTTAL
jgi:hypothetical protein